MFVFSQNKRSRGKVSSPHIHNRALEALHSFGSVSSACQLCRQACFPRGDKINDSINFLTTCFLAHLLQPWRREASHLLQPWRKDLNQLGSLCPPLTGNIRHLLIQMLTVLSHVSWTSQCQGSRESWLRSSQDPLGAGNGVNVSWNMGCLERTKWSLQ